jgi:hypothetical protein
MYFDASTKNQPMTIKDALIHLLEERSLVDKISGALLENELSSDSPNVYSTDQLTQIIRQKYYPPAREDQINSVLSNLAGQVTKVESETVGKPDHQVTLWQSTSRYNYVNGLGLSILHIALDYDDEMTIRQDDDNYFVPAPTLYSLFC